MSQNRCQLLKSVIEIPAAGVNFVAERSNCRDILNFTLGIWQQTTPLGSTS